MNDADWRIACTDPYGRERAVAIYVEHDDVLVVPPPGQAAVLNLAELDRLTRALGAASKTTS